MERYADNLKRMPPLRARDDLARMLAIAGAEKQRRDLLVAKAKDQMLRDIMSYRTPSGEHDMVEAMQSMWEGFGHAGYAGVKQLHEAYLGVMHQKMADVLNAYKRTILSGRRKQTVSMKELRRASFGQSKDPQAIALYKSFAEASEYGRKVFNELGGAIPKRQDWGMPQSHNEAAVARAFAAKSPNEARQKWSQYINKGLAWDKMFDPYTGEVFSPDMPEERKMAILAKVHDNIVTSGDIDIRPSMSPKGRGSIATQRADHRFLVFKDADFASEYNRQFGSGDEFTQMMDHLHSMAADMAIMHRFGPNPAGMLGYMVEMLRLEGARAATGKPHRLRGVREDSAQADANNIVSSAEKLLEGFFEQYRGDRPVKNKLAMSATIARNVATSALLGSSAIPHATSNWLIQSFARYAGGIPFAQVIPQLLRAFGRASHEEMLRAGLDVENGLFHIGGGAKQLAKFQKIANWSKWLPDRTTHWFGLTPIVEANKAAFFRGMMAVLGDLQKRNWADLPVKIRSKMAGYGIAERDWRVMQVAKPYKPAIGAKNWLNPKDVFLVHEQEDGVERVLSAYGRSMSPTAGTRFGDNSGPNLDTTSDATEAERIARDVGMKLLTYMHGEREIAVPSNSMRARARIYGDSEAGSWRGEFWRSFGLFKGFIGSFMVGQIHTIAALNAKSRWNGMAYAAALAVGMTLGGLVSLQLKQTKSGKDFLPMNPLTKTGFVTWLRAILTGGSLGVFGDFLASEHSSYGVGPLETLAGPVAEWPLALFGGTLDEIRNRYAGTRRESLGVSVANAALKFVRANTPALSTGWYTQAAFLRLLDHVQQSYDRDAVHKQRLQQDRLRKETGQNFWWRPGEWAPDRLPRLTPSR